MAARIEDFISRRRWAVVGVSQDPAKYGHKVFSVLLESGYWVQGVNPKGGEVLGQTIYPTLADLPEKPDVVNVVVPPSITEQIVRQCAELGLTRVWMQPGAESEEAIRFCLENGIQVVWDACAMVHRRRSWD
ncbi:MAG: CoA-binding protein [Anaerolineae bacterium]|nr:CoA-binding protein [Anaerolineae bacterium]